MRRWGIALGLWKVAVEDPVPLLGIDRLRELQRALHVGEEQGGLLALAFEGALRGDDLLGPVARSAVAGVGWGPRDGRGDAVGAAAAGVL